MTRLCQPLTAYQRKRILTYVEKHLDQELSLAVLAAVIKQSPSHFSRRFTRTMACTAHQYVIVRRMVRAKQLLTETEFSLVDIGLQVGCADQSHFTKLFRRHTGVTPERYRAGQSTLPQPPYWEENGGPANLEAAAHDALEWLQMFDSILARKLLTTSRGVSLDEENARRVHAAAVALQQALEAQS